MKNKSSYGVNMVDGPILKNMIIYAIPVVLSGVLQLLFHATDIAVVGRFAGETALAAVGSTGALTNLIINLFVGLSIGTNVLVARYVGANSYKDVQETVHTAIKLSIVGGIVLIFAGVIFATPLLQLMGSPEDVIGQASLYMQIYFLCMPFFMIYNFGSSILRAVGDTKRPLYFLIIAGIINVTLNLIFVIVFKMGVAGVASATAISQVVSALLVLRCLIKSEGPLQLSRKHLKINKEKLITMLKIGLPAGLQGTVFSLSNVIIQSTVNDFGSTIIAANTSAANIEGFVYTAMNAIYQTVLSFTGQNLGAKNFKRIKQVLISGLGLVFVIGFTLSQLAYQFGDVILQFYTDSPEVIEYALVRMSYVCFFYFLCGLMDVMCGAIRGLGNSLLPMIIAMLGVCGIRIAWIYFIFPTNPILPNLYITYPITWSIAFVCEFICFIYVYRSTVKRYRVSS